MGADPIARWGRPQGRLNTYHVIDAVPAQSEQHRMIDAGVVAFDIAAEDELIFRQPEQMCRTFHWNPAVRWVITKRLNTIVRVSGFNSSDTVLDFGTGTGILLPTLSRMVKSVLATDLRPEIRV